MLGTRRLCYLETGDPAGRVIVLLHAFPLTARMWLPQLLAASRIVPRAPARMPVPHEEAEPQLR